MRVAKLKVKEDLMEIGHCMAEPGIIEHACGKREPVFRWEPKALVENGI